VPDGKAAGTDLKSARAASRPELVGQTTGSRIARLDLDALPPGDLDARPMSLADMMPRAEGERFEGQASSVGGFDPFERLFAYAQTAFDGTDTLRPSAVLRDPATLEARRVECKGGEPTLLVDLDPEGGLLDSGRPPPRAPSFAERLERLRQSGIAIAWISGHSAAMAGDIREALARSGFDPGGTDRLVLMRYPEDRKQTRRRELAQSACILAIAGDTKSDFDELFDYVVDPASTVMLESLMGRGWFLVPPFFLPEGPRS